MDLVSSITPSVESSFITPHYIAELGEDGLTSQEIADSLGLTKGNLHTLIERLQANDMIEFISDTTSKNSNGCAIKLYLLNTDNAKFLVTQTSTKQGRGYCKFLIQCEKKLKELTKPIKPPTQLELARQVVQLLEMQEHQLKALETSQRNNAALTLKNKQLRLNLEGKNEWMSITQYLVTLQIKPTKGTNYLVGQLKTMPNAKYEMRVLGDELFSTCCFHIDFLVESKKFIELYFSKKIM